jgi:hypothetical protein
VIWEKEFKLVVTPIHPPSRRHQRPFSAGAVSIALRELRRELYIPCTMTSNNAEWERGWFYLRNDDAGLPPTAARC